jgi:hypothetical protein
MTTNNYFTLIAKRNRVVDHIFFNDQSAEGTLNAKAAALASADKYEKELGFRPRLVVWSKRRWPDILSSIKACGEVNDFLAEDENDDDDLAGDDV